MQTRLVTMCLATMFLIGVTSLSIRAQDTEISRGSLKGINAVAVIVEPLSPSAAALGLSESVVQTDVELKLRQAGLTVVPTEKLRDLPGGPYVYVNLTMTSDARAARVDVELNQYVQLVRNSEVIISATTWNTGHVFSKPTATVLRDDVKNLVETFLNAWLSVNPKN